MTDRNLPDSYALDKIASWYFTQVRDTDHMFLVTMAALKTLVSGVLEPVLQIAEEGAQRWDLRVTLTDAARNTWEQRVKPAA
ncbi:hypothetical protein ACWIGI_28885 [Nocardia sp. NPDC055321]